MTDSRTSSCYLLIAAMVALTTASRPAEAATLGISVDGRYFTIDGVPTFLNGVSYYGSQSISTPSWVAQDLDDMVADGYNWIRTWVRWDTSLGQDVSIVGYDYTGTFREPYLSRLKTLITECNSRGIIVDLTLSHSRVDPDDFQDIWEQMATEMLPYRNVYFDIANERDVGGSRYVGYVEMGQVISAIKTIDPDRLCTASGTPTSANDLEDYFNPGQCDFISPHLCRGSSSCPEQTLPDVESFVSWMGQKGFRAPVHLQEPFRRGYDTWDPGTNDFLRDASGGKIAEAAGWCFHNGSTKYSADNRPFRSFDMSGTEGRLYDQLDSVELAACDQIDEHIGGTNPNVRRYHAEYAEQVSHQIGRAEGDGWSANVSQDSAAYLTYGPYITTVGAGTHHVAWRLMIDSNSGNNDTVATLEAYDASGSGVLASRSVYRHDFAAGYAYQDFGLLFSSSSGDSLEFRTYWHDKAYIKCDSVTLTIGSQVQLAFTDVTTSSGTGGPDNGGNYGGHGVEWADTTGDGRPDFYVTMNAGVDMAELFFRNVNGTSFVEEAAARGIDNYDSGSHGGAWGDLDNDRDYDLVNGSYERNRVYENTGGGYFTDRTTSSGFINQNYGTRGVALFDYDRDGDLDVFFNNWEPNGETNEFYRNDGSFQFTPITGNGLAVALGAQGCSEGDFDNDGDQDLLLCRYGDGALILMRNDSGGFVQRSLFSSTSPRQDGATFCDVNNDGWLDVHSMSSLYLGIGTGRLFINNKNGTFTEQSVPDGPGFMAGFEDLDNDGDWDMVYPGDNKVYLNNGSGSFTASSTFSTGTINDPRCVAFADVDSDGDMDFYYAQRLTYGRLIRNNLSGGNNWLAVRLIAPNGQAGAFGAKVKTYEADQAGIPAAMISFREARSNEGYLGQNEPVLHFGLGPRTHTDVQVMFLDGTVVTRSNVPVNQTLIVDAGPLEAPVIAEVTPDPDTVIVGIEYVKQLSLLQGSAPVTWSVLQGPAGVQVDASGRVFGWVPTSQQAGGTQSIEIKAENGVSPHDTEAWSVEVQADSGLGMFPFDGHSEGWTLEGWAAWTYDPGAITWSGSGGHPGGHILSTGSGATNNNDSCTREGTRMTRVISTAGYKDIEVHYELMAALATPPTSGCVSSCTGSLLGGTCDDKLVVSYSTAGASGPWTVAQTINENDLPDTWTHQQIDLSGAAGVRNNGDFALKLEWQFNTAGDTGRIDNVSVQGTPSAAYQADFDGDDDVDQEDFGFFQKCLSGNGEPCRDGCAPADLTGDGDVDPDDFMLFEPCMGGADQPPTCE